MIIIKELVSTKERTQLFLHRTRKSTPMSEHTDHNEPEQNEIAGPVVFALSCFAIVIVVIYLIS